MSFNIVLIHYMKNLQDAPNYIKSKKVSKLIDDGLAIIKLSKSANRTFGRLLAMEYWNIIGMSVVGAFNGLNIFKGVRAFQPALIIHAINSSCVVMIYFIKLFSYAQVGQNLCNAYNEIKTGLGELQMHDDICEKQRRELKFLVDRFSIKSPIRPLDMFNMNFAHLAVLSNIIFTYSIILMQFKGY